MQNGWELSVFYNFGRTDQDQIDDGLINVDRALIALDVELAADGSVQCSSAVARTAGCAPYNPFGAGTITPEAINYLKAPGSFQAIVEQENIAITLTGDTSIDLPGGPLSFAVGYEYREEFGFDTPGALSILGTASAPQQGPTSGKFDVDEYFGEVRLPLLENVEVSVAARAGDYSTVGNIGTWMIGIDAGIVESLRLRTTYSESVRAPNVSDLFAGPAQTFGDINDVCNNLDPSANDTVTRNCLSIPAIADRVNDTGGFVLTQVERQTTGGFERGDPNVLEESAESFTAGLIWTPGFVNGLSVALDFYDIRVENAIANTARGTIVSRCYNQTSFDPSCGGAARRDNRSGVLLEVDSPSANENILDTAGFDLEINYGADLNNWVDALRGQLSFTLFLNHLTRWDEIGIVSGDIDDDVGEVTRPENRFTGTLAYDIGAWNIFWRFRFWDDVKDSNTGHLANENGGFTADGTIGELNNLDAITYHDLQIKWDFKDNISVYGGWNNILDEDPPILGQGTQYGSDGVNTNRAAYDVYGRSIYVGLRSNF